MKKPIIMVPQIISSAVCGPLSTCVFHLYCDATGGGMGTSGLVGVFSTVSSSVSQGLSGVLIGSAWRSVFRAARGCQPRHDRAFP